MATGFKNSKAVRRINVISPKAKTLDPDEVARALGADLPGVSFGKTDMPPRYRNVMRLLGNQQALGTEASNGGMPEQDSKAKAED